MTVPKWGQWKKLRSRPQILPEISCGPSPIDDVSPVAIRDTLVRMEFTCRLGAVHKQIAALNDAMAKQKAVGSGGLKK
ncbi:MAG: hypothetical protein ABJA67_05080 [Chthonomonadales bacterium]